MMLPYISALMLAYSILTLPRAVTTAPSVPDGTPECGRTLKGYIDGIRTFTQSHRNVELRFTMITKKWSGTADTTSITVRTCGAYKRTRMGTHVRGMMVAEDSRNVVFVMYGEKRILIRQQQPDGTQTTNALDVFAGILEEPASTTCRTQSDGLQTFTVDLAPTAGKYGPVERMDVAVDGQGAITGMTTTYTKKNPTESIGIRDIVLSSIGADAAVMVPAVDVVFVKNKLREEFKDFSVLDMREKKR